MATPAPIREMTTPHRPGMSETTTTLFSRGVSTPQDGKVLFVLATDDSTAVALRYEGDPAFQDGDKSIPRPERPRARLR